MPPSRHTVLGIMSGSSLDGIDLAVCKFAVDAEADNPVRHWSLTHFTTVAYPEDWRGRLATADRLNPSELFALDASLGKWIGGEATRFLRTLPDGDRPSLCGCHGHTVYHEPAAGYSVQLGQGAAIAAATGLPVVTDLRSADVAVGGQGAPLAPVADRHLFRDYGAFINLGGIVNYSIRQPEGTFLAADLTGCCQILDRLAALRGRPYDAEGELARQGKSIETLTDALRNLPFHRRSAPKSLSNQWVQQELWPLLANDDHSVADRLHTFVQFIAAALGEALSGLPTGTRVLTTGGGARNDFLIERLEARLPELIIDRPRELADFKEAALVALCALLRQLGLPNSLPSATGAARPTVNGAFYAA